MDNVFDTFLGLSLVAIGTIIAGFLHFLEEENQEITTHQFYSAFREK